MSRRARIIVEGMPHHIIQRGTRKQKVFFKNCDRKRYLSILTALTRKYHIDVWSYCLMDNHIHLVVVPKTKEGLARAMGETHQVYASIINQREEWKGHLWEGRYKSFIMSESHVYKAVRYVENNPVRAGLVTRPQDYPWSSASAHVNKLSDPLLTRFYLMDEIHNWERYLNNGDQSDTELMRTQIKTGLPLGEKEFINQLEKRFNRTLRLSKPGPKPINSN